MTSREKNTALFFLIWFALIALALLSGPLFDDFANTIVVEDLRVCTENVLQQELSSGDDCRFEFERSNTQFYVCGNIVSEKKIEFPGFFVLKGEKAITGALFHSRHTGPFCEKFRVDNSNGFGEYQVDIRYRKIVVASTYFKIK